MKKDRVITREQLRALNNPLRLEVLTYLRANGPSSAAQIARGVGADEKLLYYHLKWLVRADLIFPSGSKATATKPETLFSAPDAGLAVYLDLDDKEVRKEVQRNVQTLMKVVGREYSNALEELKTAAQDECSLRRFTASLTQDDRKIFEEKMSELTDWIQRRPVSDETKFSFTFTVVRLVQ